jgi:hypothetical protein
MKPIREKTVQVSLNFPDWNLARFVIEKLGGARALNVTLLRARLTQREALFQLEIIGAARRIDEVLKWSARRGASIRARSAMRA